MGLQKTVGLTAVGGIFILCASAAYLSDKPTMASFLRRFTTSASTSKPLSVISSFPSILLRSQFFFDLLAGLRVSS
jgi:hypothetical protein